MDFTPAAAFTTRPTLRGTFGMSASTHWLATACAQAVLERGGNAFDAAVAGAFVLHVVEPHLNGAGGDMVGIYATASEPATPRVMMGQGPAPAAATIAHYRAEGLDLVPGTGALAAAVPGAVLAWLNLLEAEGTWELRDVLAYAIEYAEHGHPVAPGVVNMLSTVRELFTDQWPSSAELWMPGGRIPVAGELITNRPYASMLRRLVAAGDALDADEALATRTPTAALAADTQHSPETARNRRIQAAREEWSTGSIAREIIEFAQIPHHHSDGADHAGVMTLVDLANYDTHLEEAVSIDFRGYTIAKSSAWGQGPVLLQTLRILDGFSDAEIDPSTEIGAHTILEALKLAMADRDTYYGHTDVDLEWLLSDAYATDRRSLIAKTASVEFRPGADRHGDAPAFRPPLTSEGEVSERPSGLGEPTVQKNGVVNGDTCHIDVVDRWGNMISATPSGGWLQSSPAIPGLGMCLGTRLQMTWLHENSPSALTPGMPPRTTLTPTLISKDGAPIIAIGSPGGDQQDQWQLLVILRMLVGNYEPQQAIDAPSFHSTAVAGSFWPRSWTPGGAVIEARLGESVIAGLRLRGHQITVAGDWELGRVSCVTRDPLTGVLTAAANPRGALGYAAGR